MHELHISDIRSFKQCRRKWWYSSPLKQNLEKKITYAPFFTGRAIHFGLQQYYETGRQIQPVDAANAFMNLEVKHMQEAGALWESEEVIVNEQAVLVQQMLEHYVKWAETEVGMFSDRKLRFMALETEFVVPFLPRRSRLAGRFDGLVQHEDGTFWIWEVKSTRSIRELEDSLVNDEQAGAYIYAAQQLFGVQVSGVLYNIMRKKAPSQPAVLQSGFLSQRADADTTAEAYSQAIKKQHPDWPAEQVLAYYGPYLQMLLDKGNTFFKRVPVYRTPYEIRQLVVDLQAVAKDMISPKTLLYPTPSWMNCRFCSFRAPCVVYSAGGDSDYLLNQEYRPRKSWDPMEAKEESTNGTQV